MPGPLDGIRVIELTSTVSGPMAGLILADQGAEVVKIEPPLLGDMARYMGSMRAGMGAMFATLNRNKRSLVLDLKEEADREIFLRLIPETDVLIENYRPGVADRLGIGYEALHKLAPELIYVSITGYGAEGPYKQRRVYDPLIQATAGASAEQSANYPANVRTVIFDKVTAYTAAQSITAALFQRERGGGGQYLPISMLGSALYYQWPDVMWSRTFQGEGVTHSGELADYFQIFSAADGYVAVILVADSQFAKACEAFGSNLHEDERFATFAARLQHGSEFLEAFNLALASQTVDEICDVLDRIGVPVARVNQLSEVFDDPQVLAQDAIVTVEHPVTGSMKIAAPPFGLDGVARIPRRHAPTHGQHSTEILRSIGVPENDIARIEAREAANREVLADFILSDA